MPQDNINQKRHPTLLAAGLAVAVAWTLIVLLSLNGSLYQHRQETEAIVLNVARTHLEKDILFRQWMTHHGTLYAPVTEKTQPNPYLQPEHFPERDIVTPSGRRLTQINPAYMIRQLYADATPQHAKHPYGRVTSLRPINPENSADPWEKKALQDFIGGATEKSELIKDAGAPLMRLIRPVIAEPDCLTACHSGEGVKSGDVMGGLSITVPMAPFIEATRKHTLGIWAAHLTLWLLVLVGIGFAFAGMHKRNLARQQGAEALRRSEAHFRSLIENALDIITVLDQDGLTVFESPSLQRVLGRKSPMIANQPLIEMLHPDDRNRVSAILARLAAQPGTTETFEMRCQHGDGYWRILEAVGQRIADLLPPAAFVINSRDITTRKLAEEKLLSYQRQLRSLAARLSQAEDETRRAIANDLHEQLGQNLSVLKLKLGTLMKATPQAETLAQLRSFDELLATTIKETRNLTFELSPPILYDIGLEAAIIWLAEQFQGRNRIICWVEDDGNEKPIDTVLRGILFRAVQEALNNVLKHAGAQRVTIGIRRVETTIRIDIVDDGCGFAPAPQDNHPGHAPGFGLFSIRERLSLLGGALEIASTPGSGTRLTMTAPLRQEADATGDDDPLPT
ncbi:MAG: DUF3365 domain-containing protein [Desulfobulbaceae bacterium]|nr:DUF3365 domain-containing protein [Desulfobulbaceae bacterium]